PTGAPSWTRLRRARRPDPASTSEPTRHAGDQLVEQPLPSGRGGRRGRFGSRPRPPGRRRELAPRLLGRAPPSPPPIGSSGISDTEQSGRTGAAPTDDPGPPAWALPAGTHAAVGVD